MVQDPSGAVVLNAEVRVINQQPGVLARVLTTDSNGAFTASLLPVSIYTIQVRSSGFGDETFSNVDVRTTETTRITAKLRPQVQQPIIEVQEEVQQAETSNASATLAKSGFLNSTPNGIMPASCCSILTKSRNPLLRMI